MGSTSRAREIARSTCLSGGIGFAFAAVLAATASAATPPFSYGGLNWEVDRYNADNYTFPVSYQGRTDVMQIDLGPNGYADNRPGPFTSQFYSTQGIKAATGLPGGEGFVSVDLFVPAAWNFNATSTVDGSHQGNNYGNFTSVGLWGQINDSSAVTQGFPILRFRNAGEVAGNYIYGWNDNLGQNIPSAGAVVNYNGWNTFRIEYRGDSYRYYLNGVLVAQQTLVNGSGQTLVDDPGNSLAYIFLNATNNNVSPESFRWSALQYGLIAITGENQNLNANLVGSVEAENTGTMNIGAGVSVSGSALVKSGGTIKGGTTATPYVVNGVTTVQAGGTLGGNGNLAGGIVSAGNISPGNSPGIITTASYNALPGATATMEVDLSAATPVNGVTHDLFRITGNSTGATTTVSITQLNAPGAGIATSGNGFELFEVGGTVSPTAFQLAAPVFSGGYQYFLNHVPNFSGTLDGFFLQSGVREEIWGHAAMLSAGKSLLASCHRSADDRGVEPGQTGGNRGWAKYVSGNLETGADTGIETEQDYSCAAGGVDFASGTEVRLGLSGGFGDTSVDLVTPAGIAELDGEQSVIEGHASYQRERVFMNLTAGYATTDWTFDGPTFGGLSATVDGIVGSMQVGMRWALGTQWRVGLMGEIDYDGTSCGDSCLIAGATENASEWRGGATLRIDGSFTNFRPFVALSYSDDFDGGNEVSMGSALVVADTAASLFGARAGFDARVSERIGVFLNAGMTEGLDSDVSGYDGQAGLKVYW